MFHSHTVWSSLAIARNRPFGLNVMDSMRAVGPES